MNRNTTKNGRSSGPSPTPFPQGVMPSQVPPIGTRVRLRLPVTTSDGYIAVGATGVIDFHHSRKALAHVTLDDKAMAAMYPGGMVISRDQIDIIEEVAS